MSPALVKKYLAAARLVADHVVLTPKGFEFAADPAVTETDRDKYCVRQIVLFYQWHQFYYVNYFMAAWRFQHRVALGQPNASLEDFVQESIAVNHSGVSLATGFLRITATALRQIICQPNQN